MKLKRMFMRFCQWKCLLVLSAIFFIGLNIVLRSEYLLFPEDESKNILSKFQRKESIHQRKDFLRQSNEDGAGFDKTENEETSAYRKRKDSSILFEGLSEKIGKLEIALDELKQRQHHEEEKQNIKERKQLVVAEQNTDSQEIAMTKSKKQPLETQEEENIGNQDIAMTKSKKQPLDTQEEQNTDNQDIAEKNQRNKPLDEREEELPTTDNQDSTHEDEPTVANTPTLTRQCDVPRDDRFSLCKWKFEKMQAEHFDKRCHEERFAVNKSDPCSILVYLSEVEPWCPPLTWRQPQDASPAESSETFAQYRSDIEGLMKLLHLDDWAWMRMRARSFWEEWHHSYKILEKKQNMKRKKKRIFLFMGAFIANTFFFKDAFTGGPLGELVQWTDVICSLYILGHDLVVSSSVDDLKSGKLVTVHDNGCAVKNVKNDFDFIISDVTGSVIMHIHLGPTYFHYKCKQLLLDSFGTDPEFNYEYYKEPVSGGRSSWANRNVHPQQLMTMYPHSPDNLFMGFAVPQKSFDNKAPTKKKMQALVYGKRPDYFKDKQKYLDILHKFYEIHANTAGDKQYFVHVPDYVINHGIVNGSTLMSIIRESKVFIGLGFPYEGPAPLDAIANGCFYINPKLIPNQNRENAYFFQDKPTFRKLTSQNPYAEDFIGQPYVYTIDINNETEIENTVQEILASKEVPHLPYEFSHEGMLQRINYFINNLNFCSVGTKWMPKKELITVKGQKGQSCKDACFRKGLLCEPSFFSHLNTMKQLKRSGFPCQSFIHLESIYAPSYNSTDSSCILQDQPMLYSCVAHNDHVTKVCPCRTYQKEQVALCKDCK